MRRSDDPIYRANRFLFCLAMTLCWCQTPMLRVAAVTAAVVDEPSEPNQGAYEQVNKLFNVLEAADHEIKRDTFDPDAIVGETGADPAKLFAWVRDRTYWIAYHGELRGAQGVLMDRLGNSLDRALCLGELLYRSGYNVRLAKGTLDDATAQKLLARVKGTPKDLWAEPQQVPGEDLTGKYESKYGVDLSSARGAVEGNAVTAMDAAGAIVQRATDQSPLIIGAVGKPAASGEDTYTVRALAALKDHWWLQFKQGNQWQDMDPTAGDAQMGEAAAKASQTISFDAAKNQFAIAPSMQHQIKIRVIAEKCENGKLTQQKAMEHSFCPAEALGQPIFLANSPVDLPVMPETGTQEELTAWMKKSAIGTHEWIPVLAIGGQRFYQNSISDTGEVKPPSSEGQTAGAAQLGGGLGGMFGGAMGGGDSGKHDSQLTAVWVEYEIDSVGETPRNIRREVFDLIGPAARAKGLATMSGLSDDQRLDRALSLKASTEILPQVCRFSGAFVADLTVRRMLANREGMLSLVRAGGGISSAQANAFIGKVSPMPGPLYDLAQMRWLCSPVGGDIYLDQANLFARVERIAADGPTNLKEIRQFDIVANDVGVRRGAASEAFSIRVTQGITDTNAEALLLKTTETSVTNAGESLNKTSDASQWSVIRKGDDPELANGQFSADVKKRIQDELAAGQIVVAPKNSTPDQATWWCIDPATGRTLGMGARGAGQALTEYKNVVTSIAMGLFSTDICLTISAFVVHNTSAQRVVKCFLIGIAIGSGLAGTLIPAFKIAAVIITGIASASQGAL